MWLLIKEKRAIFPVIFGLGLLAASAFLLSERPWSIQKSAQPAHTKAAGWISPPTVTGLVPREESRAAAVLGAALSRLRSASDGRATRALLADLRQHFGVIPKNQVVRSIRDFLDSKADVDTHFCFKVGKGGFLTDAPTLRTWLLDYLAQIDPAAAASYARVILNSADSPDEWALALRDLALGDSSPDERVLLVEKTGDLLNNQDWQQNPTTGYLEAFDVAVFLGDASLANPLAVLMSDPNNPAVAHAAFLALDRMVINNPAAILAALEADPDLMQGRENTRADYFARADVQDAQQREVLESYLLDPQIGAAEVQQFASIFPNANYMISPNLLTGNPTPNHAALVARDTASLQAIMEWLGDPRFANLRPELQVMQQRLQQFVQQEQAPSQ